MFAVVLNIMPVPIYSYCNKLRQQRKIQHKVSEIASKPLEILTTIFWYGLSRTSSFIPQFWWWGNIILYFYKGCAMHSWSLHASLVHDCFHISLQSIMTRMLFSVRLIGKILNLQIMTWRRLLAYTDCDWRLTNGKAKRADWNVDLQTISISAMVEISGCLE